MESAQEPEVVIEKPLPQDHDYKIKKIPPPPTIKVDKSDAISIIRHWEQQVQQPSLFHSVLLFIKQELDLAEFKFKVDFKTIGVCRACQKDVTDCHCGKKKTVFRAKTGDKIVYTPEGKTVLADPKIDPQVLRDKLETVGKI